MGIQANDAGWVLATKRTAYALGVNAAGRLAHRYWGARLPLLSDYPSAPEPNGWASFDMAAHLTPEEYPGAGGGSYVEPCLRATFADGTRDVALRVVGSAVAGDELTVQLQDAVFPLRVSLHYRVHAAYDLIERWATLENLGTDPITLERAWSAQWHLPRAETLRFSHLSGRWYDEMHLHRDLLSPGVRRIESRRLTTGHQHQPWFAIDRGHADEEQGEVWFGALAWSGNWALAVETTEFQSTRVSLGLNDWDFAWQLLPGTALSTPPTVAGYADAGFGAASRALHRYIREVLVPHPTEPRKVLYNSWEATFFMVDEASQMALATRAAALGVELFVLDDGWFHGRAFDTAGLGDWWPDATKFPHGLGPLIAHVNGLGMDFGLWLEPEMVNPDSDLYRAHPDWVLHFPSRPRLEARNQLILNLARDDVRAYLIEIIDRLLNENNIAFIKWDMNRTVSEPGWPDAAGDPREVWARYTQGLYHVWQTLRERHPQVVWQSCSGGGGRADLGILRLADQIWPSDNTEATARLRIQEGFSQIFPAATMEAWVTDAGAGTLPLSFRLHASMCGVLGIGANLTRWNAAQEQLARQWIARYKALRPIIQFGDLFRLRSPRDQAFSALLYVSPDRREAVLFAFRTYLPDPVELPPIQLRGLDPAAIYQIEGILAPRSGQAWMRDGLTLSLENFSSTCRHIKQESAG